MNDTIMLEEEIMKKIFISADIEGTSGIAHWNETERTMPHEYDYFAAQMTGLRRRTCCWRGGNPRKGCA